MAELQILYSRSDLDGEVSDGPGAPQPRRRGIVVVMDMGTDATLWVYGKRDYLTEEAAYYGKASAVWIDLTEILTRPMLDSVGRIVSADPATVSLGVIRIPGDFIPRDAYTAGQIQTAALALIPLGGKS